jgi:sugar phosphate isomerase/epimerase
MKPSVWSSYFIDLSPEEMVKAFSSKRWVCSELSDEHAAMLLERGKPEVVGKQFKSFAYENNFSFPQGHLWLRCDIEAPNQTEVVDKLKEWLELFHAVGIHNAVLHPGSTKKNDVKNEADRALEVRVRALRELSDFIKGTDMTICLENIFGTVPECDDLLEIIEAASCSNIGICLDTGHLNICSGDQAGFIKKAGKYLKALHIADNEGKYDQHLMPFGRGTVNWGETIAALKKNNYESLFNYEIPGENRCPLPVRLAKLDYLKDITEIMLKTK